MQNACPSFPGCTSDNPTCTNKITKCTSDRQTCTSEGPQKRGPLISGAVAQNNIQHHKDVSEQAAKSKSENNM